MFELPAANLVVTTAAEIQIQNNDPLHPIIRIIKPYADLDNADPGKAARTDLIVFRDLWPGKFQCVHSGPDFS